MTETDGTSIAKGSAYLVTERMVNTVIRAVAFAFIARILTQTEMGVTVALTLTLSVGQLLSDLGFSSGLAKYIAEYRGRNADYSPLLFSGFLIKTLIAGSIAVTCAVASQQLSELLLKSGEYAILFQLLSIYLLLACINMTMNSFLLGLNRIREMAILNVVAVFTRQISMVALLMYGYGLAGLTTGWIFGDLIYIILSASIIVKGKHVRKYSTREITPHLKMLAKFSWPLLLVNIVVFLYSWFDRAVLLAYVPLSELGIYNVAFQAFSVLYLIPGALSTALFPYYSEQYGRNKHENIAIAVRGATRYITLLYTPLALGLMITANPAITLFAGPLYARGDTILAIFSLLGGICSISAVLGILLLVYNMTPTLLLINLVSIGASMVMMPVLLPRLGVTGMAIIKGTAMIILLVLAIAALKRRVRMEFDKQALWKSWGAGTIMLIAVGLMEQVYFNAYLLPVYILVGGVTYMGALRILKVVDQDDLKLVRNLLGNRATFIANILEKILT